MLQDELVKLNLDWVVNYYPYENPNPVNSIKLEKMLISHIKKGSKIMIFPDSDIDGVLSALEMKSLCELLGCKNITLMNIKGKSHGLSNKFIDQVVREKADLLITVDSTTNNKDEIERLSSYGIDHIIIDHHTISENIIEYPNNVVVVNSKDIGNESFSCVSAGMLCYIVIHNLLNKVKIEKTQKTSFLNKMFILGYITLYTDCMDLANVYNLSVIGNVEPKIHFTPRVITQFMTKYDCLNRNFIEFKFGPRVNSLIRQERFDIVYKLFFNKISDEERADLLSKTELLYVESKKAVEQITSLITVNEYDNFAIGNLDTVSCDEKFTHIAKNYTGLIANNIAQNTGKLAVVISSDTIEDYKGSVRDPLNRKSLELFKYICECGGHMSAFGFHIHKCDYRSFVRRLQLLSTELAESSLTSRIILDGDEFDERLAYQLRGIAEYNEVGGNTIPKVVIRKRLGHGQKITRYETYSKVDWSGVQIVCFTGVYLGDMLCITPTLTENGVVCYGVREVNE